MLSYWEHKTWLSQVDFTVVGSGIVGIHTALRLRERYPKAKILVLEKGVLPSGASTKNAGFACFGSLSELLSDLHHMTRDEVVDLVEKRYKGLKKLRKTLGDPQIDYQKVGGYELFLPQDTALYEKALEHLNSINEDLKPIFGTSVFSEVASPSQMKGILKNSFFHKEEGQIDTGKMMQRLLQLTHQNDILIVNHVQVVSFETINDAVSLQTTMGDFNTRFLFIATNGFAHTLFPDLVKPARAQVLITKPIDSLHLNSTYHLQEGYYYFRSIDNRVLLGGGRNIDFEGETTTEMEVTQKIQEALEHMLREIILPGQTFEIERRWSGVMGVGAQKFPHVKRVNERVFAGVRLGGMGVALGSWVGTTLADLMIENK